MHLHTRDVPVDETRLLLEFPHDQCVCVCVCVCVALHAGARAKDHGVCAKPGACSCRARAVWKQHTADLHGPSPRGVRRPCMDASMQSCASAYREIENTYSHSRELAALMPRTMHGRQVPCYRSCHMCTPS